MPRSFSDNGKKILKEQEGFRLDPYQDDGGVWTVGYGHTGPDVVPGAAWTKGRCDAMFEIEAAGFADQVDRLFDPSVKLNQNQFDALVIFAYNIGVSAFKSSSIYKLIKANEYSAACRWWSLWNRVRNPATGRMETNKGLTARRAAEIALFLTPVG